FTEWQQTTKQIDTYNSMLTGFTKLLQAEETRFSNGESSLFLINARELKVLETQQKLIELRAKNKINHVKVKWAAGLLGGN
ncbi:MAG TPA: TolC family protein, partial [Chitinophagaceae bacterium]|nr:TolC family protein [Chitinophagaceae bacterium]